MTASWKALIIGTAAGAVGLTLGYLSTSGGRLALSTGAKELVTKRSEGNASSYDRDAKRRGALLPFASSVTQDRVIATIEGGDPAALTRCLDDVVADGSLPPIVQGIYRDALVERLVRAGKFKEVMEAKYPASNQDPIRAAAVRAFTQIDPVAAEAAVKSMPVGHEKEIAMPSLLYVLGKSDPKRGLALIASDTQASFNVGSLFSGWAEVDPQAAVEAAFKPGGNSDLAQMSAVSTWAENDPRAAWQWIEKQPMDRRNEALPGYFDAIARYDPSSALREIGSNAELNRPYLTFRAQWIGLALGSDVKAANAAMDQLPPGTARTELVNGLAGALSGNPTEAIEWTKSLLPGEREGAINEIFRRLGITDPEQGLDAATRELDGSLRQKAQAAVLKGWVLDDPLAAISAAIKKLDKTTLDDVLPEIFREQDLGDAPTIEREISMIRESDAGTASRFFRAWGQIATRRSGFDPFQYASKLSPAERSAYAEGLIAGNFDLSPDAVKQTIEMLSPEAQAQRAREIGEALSRTDLAGAAQFLAALPDGNQVGAKRRAMQDVVEKWAYAAPDQAIAFVGGLAPGETRDLASRSLVGQLTNFDLDAATRVAATATTPKIRDGLISDLARAWARVDPAQGRAAMASMLQTDHDRAQAAALFPPQ
jgi:hypothetical protein